MTFGGKILKTEDLLTATGPVFDVFSYHLYAAAHSEARAWAQPHKRRLRLRFRRSDFPTQIALMNFTRSAR